MTSDKTVYSYYLCCNYFAYFSILPIRVNRATTAICLNMFYQVFEISPFEIIIVKLVHLNFGQSAKFGFVDKILLRSGLFGRTVALHAAQTYSFAQFKLSVKTE